VVDDQGPIARREQLAQPHRANRRVARAEIRGTLLEGIVLHCRSLRQIAAERRDPFALLHQLDLRLPERLPLREILGGLVREICLSIRPVDYPMHHRFALLDASLPDP
jgi:hypothetical protein